MTDAQHHTQLFSIEMEIHKLFCPGCPGSVILVISASQAAKVTGVSHRHTVLLFFNFLFA
jgi:hypothetical protein